MNFITLDLGTTTGFAINNYEKIIKSGSVNFKPTRFESHSIRFSKFKSFLEKQIKDYNIKQCFYEEVRMHKGIDAAHMYGGYLAILQTICLDFNIEYAGVSVGTIKKHITGNGHASKSDVIHAVKHQLDLYPKDDNEADAIALSDYCLKKLI